MRRDSRVLPSSGSVGVVAVSVGAPLVSVGPDASVLVSVVDDGASVALVLVLLLVPLLIPTLLIKLLAFAEALGRYVVQMLRTRQFSVYVPEFCGHCLLVPATVALIARADVSAVEYVKRTGVLAYGIAWKRNERPSR